MHTAPRLATVIGPDGEQHIVKAEHIKIDDRLLVKRGTQLEVRDLASGRSVRVPIVDSDNSDGDSVRLFGTTIVYISKVCHDDTDDKNVHVFDDNASGFTHLPVP